MPVLFFRKFRKLIFTPRRFFADAARKMYRRCFGYPLLKGRRPRLFIFGLSPWKKFLGPFFPGNQLIYIDRHISQLKFEKSWSRRIGMEPSDRMLIWGFKAPRFLRDFVDRNNVPLMFAEDGFLRSIELGASKTPPYSLCIDTLTPYFDAHRPSDLEMLLLKHDFAGDHTLMSRARLLAKQIINSGLSKYNQGEALSRDHLPKTCLKKRVLVLGQVEDDASIIHGCKTAITNNDLVRLAHSENLNAQIIYKAHPDVMSGYRSRLSDPADVADLCTILDTDIALAETLCSADHVYTITSLAGFEAALRGIRVTTLGCPFYAGWGFTDDREPSERRTRKLTPLEVFAGAYLLYPKYVDPVANTPATAEWVVERLSALRADALARPAPQ